MHLEIPLRWIGEREAIRRRREAGEPAPLTSCPILGSYRFCNVRREDDRVTRWIANIWRGPHAHDPHLWFGMAVARFVNWPDTLAALGYPVPWDADHFKRVLRARNGTTFGSAYVIPNGGSTKPKIDYLADDILSPLWKAREHLSPKPGNTLAVIGARLQQFKGIGGFLMGQIVADLKYVEPLRSSADWMTFVVSGPGSRRGLNRVLGRPVNNSWPNEASWRTAFGRFETAVRPELQRVGLGDLHAQDLQNCLCETDKYWRALNGEGKPKRRYTPRAQRDAAE